MTSRRRASRHPAWLVAGLGAVLAVIDPGSNAVEYRPAMVRIARHAWIMAEICDSFYMKKVG